MLNRCRDLNVTISKKKFEINNSIEFAAHIVSDIGIRPDDKKYQAVSDFSWPINVSTLRSFLGLAQQLGSFIPDLSHMVSRMRGLLTKGVAWTWLPEHEHDFELVKQKLTSKTLVHLFNPSLKTILLTDASCLYGIGFCLVQEGAQKYDYYLRGLPSFEVWTDHRPLIGPKLTTHDSPGWERS